MVTESESREYAQFARQPSWLDVQVGNGEAGVYAKDKRCTERYVPAARIGSLWVSHPIKKLPDDIMTCPASTPAKR